MSRIPAGMCVRGNVSANVSSSNRDEKHIFLFLSPITTIHYRKPALCQVPEALSSVFYRALGKDGFAECFFRHSTKMVLPNVFFWHSAKRYFAVCIFFGPRQIIFSKQFLRPEMNSNEKLFNYKVA